MSSLSEDESLRSVARWWRGQALDHITHGERTEDRSGAELIERISFEQLVDGETARDREHSEGPGGDGRSDDRVEQGPDDENEVGKPADESRSEGDREIGVVYRVGASARW